MSKSRDKGEQLTRFPHKPPSSPPQTMAGDRHASRSQRCVQKLTRTHDMQNTNKSKNKNKSKLLKDTDSVLGVRPNSVLPPNLLYSISSIAIITHLHDRLPLCFRYFMLFGIMRIPLKKNYINTSKRKQPMNQ